MKEIIKMLSVLTIISGVCGFLLAGVKFSTADRIIDQILKNVQGPAIETVLAGSTNKVVKDRKEILAPTSNKEVTVFLGKNEKGDVWAISFESYGKGRDDEIGVMVGVNMETNKLTGVAITTIKDSPGFGSKATEENFTRQYKDKSITENFEIKSQDGTIDAVSGATITSQGVIEAVKSAITLYEEIKVELQKETK